MEIAGSARASGIADPDIEHAWTNAIRVVEFAADGAERLLVIGPNRAEALLELVAAPGPEGVDILYADWLQPERYRHLGMS